MTDVYSPNPDRYANDSFFRRCGRSGLKLPAISLGCWHNFGGVTPFENARDMLYTAFDHGVTHFDLANNYGPPPGSAEENVGKIVKTMPRDEIVISSKAGYLMWPGPYGEWGSRKYLLASLDQSLRRLQLDYVDIFYSHRFDADTPLEETLGALNTAVQQGKALYAGISSYNADQTREAVRIMREYNWTRLIIHQPNYSMLNRWIETKGLLDACEQAGMGIIAFCPLYQGVLTGKYLDDVPADSRVADPKGFLKKQQITPSMLDAIRKLNEIAKQRGQSMAQLALAWTLRDERVTTALIGASRPAQIEENVAAAKNTTFSDDEQKRIDEILANVETKKSPWASGE